MRDVFGDRRGVCQDFAHVMIGLCRALHIPTLYVSGYLYNGPRDPLLGAQASHAWCEVFIPGRGWSSADRFEHPKGLHRCADIVDSKNLRATEKASRDARDRSRIPLCR